jgi:galactokinase
MSNGDGTRVRVWAPGRVNLIGEHTDYAGGLALPIALDRGTTVTGVRRRGAEQVRLRSEAEPEPAVVPLDVGDPASVRPAWARYVAGVVAELRPASGFEGTVTTTLPIGAGLSSSAALELAVALALGFEGAPTDLALLGQRAEQRASGVPCGLMDQLVGAAGKPGHALLIDFGAAERRGAESAAERRGAEEPAERRGADVPVFEDVPLPEEAEIVVLDSGQRRTLAGGGTGGAAYAERRASVEAAAARLGPLRTAAPADIARLDDPVLRRRARHVITENQRVLDLLAALRAGDLATAGAVMDAGHVSLRDDFEVSTPVLDQLVTSVRSRPGVHGARLTGAGFGGCVVALTEAGALRDQPDLPDAWVVRAGSVRA